MTSEPKSPSSVVRNEWVDLFRGLGIILVVAGHVIGGLAIASFVVDREPLQAAYGWIYSFHMPALFFASGLFAETSFWKHGFRSFVADKVRTLAYPMYLWPFITWLCHAVMQKYTNTPFDPKGFTRVLCNPTTGYWFLAVLFGFMMLYSILRRVPFGAVAFHALLIGGFFANLLTDGATLPDVVRLFSRFGLFFSLGILIGQPLLRRTPSVPNVVLGGLCVAGFGLVTALAPPHASKFETWPAIGLAVAGTAGLYGLSVLVSRLARPEATLWCGRHSLEIYLAAGLTSVPVRIVLHRTLAVTSLGPHLVLGILGGLIGPWLLVTLADTIGLRYLFKWPKFVR